MRFQISGLCIVPPLVVFLAKHPLVDKYDLTSLKYIVSGAAPLSKDVQKAAQERLKLKEDIRQGYGMTELSVSTTLMPTKKNRMGSVGVVVPGMKCKVSKCKVNNLCWAFEINSYPEQSISYR